MKAAWYVRTGPAAEVLQLGERDDPAAGPGEVLVRVHASGVNPADTKRRAGWRGQGMAHPLVIPHTDGAGVIAAVGDGVPAARVGERVWLYNAQGGYGADIGRAFGTAAEYCALPAAQAVPLPDGIGFAEGAGLPVPATTAHRAVFADGPVTGRAVLVAGGAGAVAQYAIGFARDDGARIVIATVSSEEKAACARAAGAHATVDYRREDVVARVTALAGGPVDRIVEVDFGTNLPLDVDLIAPNGTIASYSSTRIPEPVLPYYGLQSKGVTVRFVQGFLLTPAMRAAAVARIDRMAAAGALRHPPIHRYPLARIAEAHAAAESGAVGKVVVEIA